MHNPRKAPYFQTIMRYKKRIIIVAGVCFVIMVFLIILAIFLTDTPTVQLAFLSYTNTGAGSEAVFSVRFPPTFGAGGFRDPEVSRKEGAVWKSWSPTNAAPPTWRFFQSPPPIKLPAGAVETPFKGKNFVAFSVETTNEVSRIVIQVDEHPHPRPQSRLVSAIGVVWGLFRMSTNAPGVRSYFITNETSVIPAA